jgi:hypothetical protein
MPLASTQSLVNVTAKNLDEAAKALTAALADFKNARIVALVQDTNRVTRIGQLKLLAVVDHD